MIRDHEPWGPLALGAVLGILLTVVLSVVLAPASVEAADPRPGCHPVEVNYDWAPTGIAGCELIGPTTGIASWWGGDFAAANWCEWPWTDCGSARVTSLDTGLEIIVPIRMFCDCYTGTAQERLIDLSEAQVLALGLDPARGLFDVVVTPVREGSSSAVLPNTAMQP